ncbi:YheC/YheD family protein [Bacillus suaedaesalsae]|uniref:YheC/YheD family protein n=1 Tax=Bacillus suaedaesalsae TaxID=2810349 RepID=A0ABS2DH22_9BACI|nr:YheC/YheD family protein [Bacillus suaedaesalsae]MBM6617779.1 YheC/YheD family protein [Bacillus suaedaesalsae]
MIVSEKVKIEKKQVTSSPREIEMDEVLFYKWSISTSKKYKIQCGDNSVQVTFIPSDIQQSIRMDESLFRDLQLPPLTHSLHLYLHEGLDIFTLGIFIGLLTEVKETEYGVSFGSVHEFCVELATYCVKNETLFYVFSLKNYHEPNLKGYVWNGESWELHDVPWPHVVHNRIHSRKREQSTEYQQFTLYLKEKHIPFFNDHFLNKWESHQHLVQQDHLLAYLPHTELLLNFSTLDTFLQQHKSVYIKPIHGSQGRKIFRIEDNGKEYILDYTTFTGDIEKSYETTHDLFIAIRPRLKGAFIIQQGIPLLRYENRILDFRFLCHLNTSNDWKVTSSVARISSPKEFVSNIARGGEIQKVQSVLRELLDPKQAITVGKVLHELAIEIASSIGQSEEGLFGEFGIDLALDENGKPWIIEVNTKPSKNMDASTPSTTIRPSARSVINYCLYLANPFRGVN